MRALRCPIFAAMIAVVGCSSDNRPPTGPDPGPTPQPAGIQITGAVIGHDAPGAGSPRSATMSIWYETDRGGQTAGPAQSTNANGTFTITAPADARAVRFMAEASGFVQPCLATLRLTGATSYSFDVHLVRESALSQLRTFSFVRSPFVEGLVYETTPAGRRGVRDASIVVDGASGLGLSLADTVTDDQGRFVLCGFEGETSMVLFAVKAGYELATVNLPIGPETAVEIELRR